MIAEERIKSHYESLERAIRFVRTTDAKAAPAIGLQIALVGTLAARSDKLWAVVGDFSWHSADSILVGLIALYGIFVVAVVTIAVRVYMPMHPGTGKSLIYFEDISSMEYEEFELQSREVTLDQIERQLLDQVYRVSQIASTKMRRVWWAFLLTAPTSVLWLVILAWGTIQQ